MTSQLDRTGQDEFTPVFNFVTLHETMGFSQCADTSVILVGRRCRALNRLFVAELAPFRSKNEHLISVGPNKDEVLRFFEKHETPAETDLLHRGKALDEFEYEGRGYVLERVEYRPPEPVIGLEEWGYDIGVDWRLDPDIYTPVKLFARPIASFDSIKEREREPGMGLL